MLERAGTAPVLFLIDEMLSGTNSGDRRVASEAALRALIDRGATGMITTHDLVLTEIAEAPGLFGANSHLADAPGSGGLAFDYRLRPGVLRHSNAIAIVRAMGIPIDGAAEVRTG